MKKNPIAFRGPVEKDVAARAKPGVSLGLIAERDLERYYYALDVALGTVELTEAEASLIVDAQNATLVEPHSVQFLWANVADAIRLDGLADKWSVDGPALVTKLQSLDYWQTLAISDAAERFWAEPNEPDRLRAVGLIR